MTPTDVIPPDLQTAILAWYAERGRPLAFRRTTDPYAILVSEAMAQQTQAARAAEAWERFMDRYPTVAAVAAAPLADVLRAWQGLGYDRRARHLWQAARLIVERHHGIVPSDVTALEALPGIGPYTARAVAALAFGVPVGAVDTNVRRVLGRIVAGGAAAIPAKALQAVADAAVPLEAPGRWTHALMDLGATVCQAARADCDHCPAKPWCRFAADGAVIECPVRVIRETPAPFSATNRWLRGRIMDRLRDVPDPAWATIKAPLGSHDRAAIDQALEALAADGMIELEPIATGARRARLHQG